MKNNLTPRINVLEPNLIIDGAHEIWPEGTSRTVANNTSAYGSVLFKCQNFSTGISLTNSQITGPTGTELSFANQISKTLAGTLASSTFVSHSYHIEGYDIERIVKNSWSLIFVVKSSKAVSRSVSVRAGGNFSYIQQYTINSANTPQLVVVNFPALNTCPGVLLRTNGIGAQIDWSVVMGSDYKTSQTGQWVAGVFRAALGEDTTWLTETTHDFSISGVMVLPGDWSGLDLTTYRFIRAGKNFAHEAVMVERYFEKSSAMTAALNDTATGTLTYFPNTNYATTSHLFYIQFRTRKRVAPTMTIFDGAGNLGRFATLATGGPATNNLVPGDLFSRETFFGIQMGAVGAHAGWVVGYGADARF